MIEKILLFIAGLDQNQLILFGIMSLVFLYCIWRLIKPVVEWPLKLMKKIPKPKSRFGRFVYYTAWVIWWVPVTPLATASYAAYKNPELVQQYASKAHTTYKVVKVAMTKK